MTVKRVTKITAVRPALSPAALPAALFPPGLASPPLLPTEPPSCTGPAGEVPPPEDPELEPAWVVVTMPPLESTVNFIPVVPEITRTPSPFELVAVR